jgi:hypothetical protein
MENQGQIPLEEKREVDFEIIKDNLYQIVDHKVKNVDTEEWVTIKREVLPIPVTPDKTLEHYNKERAELVKKQKQQLDEAMRS